MDIDLNQSCKTKKTCKLSNQMGVDLLFSQNFVISGLSIYSIYVYLFGE